MKQLHLGLILFVFTQLLMAEVPFSDGLVGYYPFNGNCFDYSKNLNHGITTGYCLCEIPYQQSFNSSKKTIMFWFYVNSPGPSPWFPYYAGYPYTMPMIETADGHLDTPFSLNVRFDDGALTKNPPHIFYVMYKTQDGKRTRIADTKINVERWYHVACVFTENSISIYLDSELIARESLATPLINSYRSLVLSNDYDLEDMTEFRGSFDELRLYNRALSYSEIKEIFEWTPEQIYPTFYVDKTPDIEGIATTSTGTSWGDFDNDGDEDLFIATDYDKLNSILINNGQGNFTSYTSDPLITNCSYSTTGTWGDVDNDADLDLFICNKKSRYHSCNNFLYINQGDVNFIEVTNKNVVLDESSSISAAWADYDRDGFLDLFVANKDGEDNLLYHNKGDGGLKKMNMDPITTDGGNSRACTWGDYNNDGWPDLFVANNDYENNFLYQNNGDGSFTKVLNMDVVTDELDSWGGSWGDMDNDGDLDLYVINSNSDNCYYENKEGVLTKAQIESTWGPFTTRGSSLGDFNNDGRLDIVLAHNGWYSLLYLSDSAGTFNEYYLPKTADGQGVSNCDIDNDGDLDLYIPFNGSTDVLLENQIDPANWVKFKCQGVQSNASAIGAKVRIKADCGFGTVWQMREISAQTGGRSQNSMICHFGLGTAQTVDSLRIEWPSGIVWDTTAIAINQQHLMIEHEKITLPPTAFSDSVSVYSGQSVVIHPLLNDWANDAGTLTLQAIDTTATLGEVILSGDSLTYTAPTDFQGSDSLFYIIQNAIGLTDTANVILLVTANPILVAFPDSIQIEGNGSVTFNPLNNDTSPSENELSIICCDTSVTMGTVELVGDTCIVYTPIYGYAGLDSILYIVGNGTGMTDTAKVYIQVSQPSGIAQNLTIPEKFELSQNYPNPFNPNTTIPYALAENSPVKITIFNALGRQVRSLVDGKQTAGNYRVVWDGRDNAGTVSPTGMYFVRMETEQFKATRKVLFLR